MLCQHWRTFMPPALNPSRTALVLIDMQRDVVEGFAYDQGVVQRFAAMLGACRDLGLPIVYVTFVRRADLADTVPAIADHPIRPRTQPSAAGGILVEGTPGSDIVDELEPLPGEYRVERRRSSAFFGTPLETFLRAGGVDTVLIGGIATEMGVEIAVRDGRDRDFNFVVLADCCSSVAQEFHEYALAKMLPRIARVMTSDHALRLLSGAPAPGRET
jgi:biuret amidohydrolase